MLTHDIAEYITWNVARPEFYVKDVLPKQGVMLIYGEPKVKKSWLAQYLGFCIATGTDWLGMRTEQARTLIANFEISPLSYHWRLKDMGRHFQMQNLMFYESSPMLMYLDDEHNFNEFAEGVRAIRPKVIILDCMAASFGGDENDGQQVARWIEKISAIKTENDASVVIIHHTNKNMLSGSSVDRARGHSRLTGWVDTLCYMALQPTGVQLQFKARQATRDVPNINVEFVDYLWRIRGANAQQQTQTI
jgi:RecA-family ATPase